MSIPGEHMSKLALDEKHPIASRVPSQFAQIDIEISGPQVGSWAIEHFNDDLRPSGLCVLGGGPELSVRTAGRRAYGPTEVDGRLVLGLVIDRGTFANNFEAIQIAIERLSQLPDADHLAHASLRIEAKEEPE